MYAFLTPACCLFQRTRSHDGKPAHMWDKTEDRPFEWETHDDDDVL
jgi:hypothetical protein